MESFGKRPLTFELNQGQADPSVQFLSRGPGYTLFLRPNEAVLVLGEAGRLDRAGNQLKSIVRMQLTEANLNPAASLEDQQITRSNYFIGSNSANWRSNIPNYGRVGFKQVYPGIDLTYYGSGRQLEHDFAISAGADPARIAFRLTGGRPQLDHASGDLVLRTHAGEVRLRRPIAYQELDGRRRSVAVRYKLLTKNRVRFTLGKYDRSRELVIDPLLVYSTLLGGTGACAAGTICVGDSWANAVAVDSAGNAYVTGMTEAFDFPTSSSAFQTANKELCANTSESCPGAGNSENGTAFVTKLNTDGTAVLYSTYLGGTNPANWGEQGFAIAVDAEGNAYVAGETASPDFPTTAGALQAAKKESANYQAGFITKLNSSGSGLVYSTYLGGSDNDVIYGIAVDNQGRAYLTGVTYSLDFPTTPNAFEPQAKADLAISGNAGGATGFVSKLNAGGSSLVYSTFLGGSTGEAGVAIAVDGSGDAYVGGITGSQDFPVTAGAFQLNNYASIELGNSTGFVTKLNPSGTGLTYSTYLGGEFSDGVRGITVNGQGNAYVTGGTFSWDFPTTSGAFQEQLNGLLPGSINPFANAFVTEFNPAGTSLVFSTFLGGTGSGGQNGGDFLEGGDFGQAIALDGAGNVIVAGATSSLDFPVTADGFQQVVNAPEGFVSELNPAGSQLLYSSYVGGNDETVPDYVSGLAIDVQNNVYIVGITSSISLPVTSFPVTQGALQSVQNAGEDAFVAKLDLAQAPNSPLTAAPVFSLAPGTYSSAQTVTITDATPGATIYVGINSFYAPFSGTVTPQTGLAYTGPIPVSSTETIQAIALAPGSIDSPVTQGTYTINLPQTAASPVFSPSPGSYQSAQSVTLTDSTAGAFIYYTTDGTTPIASSKIYGGPITVLLSETIEAVAVADGYTNSAVVSAKYTITPGFSLAVSPSSVQVNSGSSVPATVSIATVGGFDSAVSFGCSGLPAGVTCSFLPTTVTPPVTTFTTVMLTAALNNASLHRREMPGVPVMGLAAAFCWLGWRKRRSLPMLVVLAVGLAGVGMVNGCGGGGSSGSGGGGGGGGGTQPVTSTVTVTATSGMLQETTTFTLTVN